MNVNLLKKRTKNVPETDSVSFSFDLMWRWYYYFNLWLNYLKNLILIPFIYLCLTFDKQV